MVYNVKKGFNMAISSATATAPTATQTPSSSTPMEKAIETQKKQVEQILESAQAQSQQTTAQKTGIGGNINITA